uniref:Uncharacterized protein n=1 Tax=Loa loa TaxID=7209 RepID=A0A1I7VS57_LOALO
MRVKDSMKESSLSYLITRNLKCLENTARKVFEKAIELREKDLSEGLSYERTVEWLKGQKSDVEKQVIVTIEWKELLRPANDDEWQNNVASYEDCLYEGYCLFDKGNKLYCERASLLMKLNRISKTIIEVKMKYEKADHEPPIAEEQKSPEDLIKIITTSKPPTLKSVEFDGDPRMWGQFISEFEESIHNGFNVHTKIHASVKQFERRSKRTNK